MLGRQAWRAMDSKMLPFPLDVGNESAGGGVLIKLVKQFAKIWICWSIKTHSYRPRTHSSPLLGRHLNSQSLTQKVSANLASQSTDTMDVDLGVYFKSMGMKVRFNPVSPLQCLLHMPAGPAMLNQPQSQQVPRVAAPQHLPN